MIYKNNYTFLKFLPFVRIFFIALLLFLIFFVWLPAIEFSGTEDWVGVIALGLIPILFFSIILFEACFTKYFESFEFKN